MIYNHYGDGPLANNGMKDLWRAGSEARRRECIVLLGRMTGHSTAAYRS
jgi:hypothetical protein